MTQEAEGIAFTDAQDADLIEKVLQAVRCRPGLRQALHDQLADKIDKDRSPRLRLDKAKDDGVPLVKWLLARDPAAKLAAVVADAVIGSDIEMRMKQSGTYDGEIGHDLRRDWEQDVIRMIDAPDTPPEDRAVAAYIMGAITVS